ncbi:MAG: hypothetical protein Q9170_003167 [Blastenia crenularia]
MTDWINADLVDQLATGFGALLEQVQELDKRNAHLEHLLCRMQEQALGNKSTSSPAQTIKSVPSVYQRDTTGSSHGQGLHIEDDGNQLHLTMVPENIRWEITEGFHAWGELRRMEIGQYPQLPILLARRRRRPTKKPPPPDPDKTEVTRSKCPFASQQASHGAETEAKDALSDKAGVTPSDHAYPEDIIEDPTAAEDRPADVLSHDPSQTGSASKCPIRYLDQYSPEEVAAYFKEHRHEIPRSHEVCVRRYQRNEDQIRQLDHKYGNLVSMIQGLGQKHQPMLHTRTGEENVSQGHTSQGKVEAWAKELSDDQEAQADHAAEVDASIMRDGHFDRPLKEIRVGESPSRPWGISIPHAAHIAPSAASVQEDLDLKETLAPEMPTPSSHPPLPPKQSRTDSALKSPRTIEGQPKMIFTGPVFIGYPPEQVADLLQRTGLGKVDGV